MINRLGSAAARGFFSRRRAGEPGLAVFLNAGDPPLGAFRDIVQMLDELRVDCLELAVPFPGSCTDGPVIRRSATRALRTGVDLAAVLGALEAVRAERTHLRVALLLDWSHTIKPVPMPEAVARLAASATDALLVHGLPPRLRSGYYRAAREHGVPIITTCYPRSSVAVRPLRPPTPAPTSTWSRTTAAADADPRRDSASSRRSSARCAPKRGPRSPSVSASEIIATFRR
jgi:tryptophan synthase alpha subunit